MRVASSPTTRTSSTQVARARHRRGDHRPAPRRGSFCSLHFMCTGEVEMKVWMRAALGVAHRLAGAVDVGLAGARQAADRRVLDALGDLGDGLEVAVRRRSGSRPR